MDSAVFDELEGLGMDWPELRGYFARATGGVDFDGLRDLLRMSKNPTNSRLSALLYAIECESKSQG